MARNHNDDLPLAAQENTHVGHGSQPAGNTYNVKTFPGLFGELVGRRIGATYRDNSYFGCLVKYARADEFQVEILVQRNFKDLDYNADIRLRTSGVIVMTMEYEGRIDGIDQFNLKGLESRTWTVGLNHYGEVIRQKEQCPNYDIGIFGAPEEVLRRDYGTFFRVADAESLEAGAGSQHRRQEAPLDHLANSCGCW